MINWDNALQKIEERAVSIFPEQNMAMGFGGLHQRLASIGTLIAGNRYKYDGVGMARMRTELFVELAHMAVICKRMFDELELKSESLISDIEAIADKINHPQQ
jgi:hypothetical protein